MKMFKDKKIIVLVGILIIYTIGYFILVNKVSYAFTNNTNNDFAYNNLINIIKDCTKEYVKKNNVLGKEEIAYIKVQDLVDAKLLLTTEGNNVISPLDHKTVMNSNLIKIKKDNNEIIIEVDG